VSGWTVVTNSPQQAHDRCKQSDPESKPSSEFNEATLPDQLRRLMALDPCSTCQICREDNCGENYRFPRFVHAATNQCLHAEQEAKHDCEVQQRQSKFLAFSLYALAHVRFLSTTTIYGCVGNKVPVPEA
jgi:hypothetical protein